jgi:hypothetical protein
VASDVGERLCEERSVYSGGSVPVLDCFAGGGCCVWDSGCDGQIALITVELVGGDGCGWGCVLVIWVVEVIFVYDEGV